MRRALWALGGMTALAVQAAEAPPPWHAFAPAEVLGARSWLQSHPTLDGRGLYVAVLDTGVDPRASGLESLPQGGVKVVEARDFTGQGDVSLEWAPPLAGAAAGGAGTLTLQLGALQVRDVQALLPPPPDARYYLGVFHETQIGPPELRDLNRDGKPDGDLALLAWRIGPGDDDVRVAMDLDGNGSFAGEQVVGPYHVAAELLLPPARNPAQGGPQLSFAVEPDLPARRVSLHFTDGSHGTHVAGIIAGHRTNAAAGWDGVAPGARILSLKIGHNARAGGATTTESFKKALDFAAKWSREKAAPVVVNASYGTAAGTPGHTDIDSYVDKLVAENPLLTVSFSAGNEGPGLSTVGTPAGADLALAVGALVPRDSVPTLYGGRAQGDELFAFSSRGGDLCKPEVVAPGTASAAVPVWDAKEIKQGTSMAAPHIAGAMLLVWSALLATPGAEALLGRTLHSGVVRSALIASAAPIAGYELVAQGAGIPNIERAAAIGRRLAPLRAPLGYHLEHRAPRADGKAVAGGMWRSGVQGLSGVTKLDVRALLPTTWPAAEREAFSAPFELASEADWLEVARPQVLLRGERPTTLELRLHPERLRQPGLYSTRLVARPVGAASGQIAWQAWQTVVVPERFDSARGWSRGWSVQHLAPGRVWRTFVQTPPGARQLRVSARRHAGAFAQVSLAAYGPDSGRVRPPQRVLSSRDGTDVEWLLAGERFTPGTWELTFAASLSEVEESHFDVEVAFTALEVRPIAPLRAESGGLAATEVTLSHVEDRVVHVSGRGRVDRVVRQEKADVTGDRYSRSVILGPESAGATLRFRMDTALFDKTTDVAMTVSEEGGKELASGGFAGSRGEISFRKTGAGEQKFTVQVAAAFAHKQTAPWKLDVEESFEWSNPVALAVTGPDGAALSLYPFVPQTLTLKAQSALPQPVKNGHWAGQLELVEADGRQRWLVLPLERLGPGAALKPPHKLEPP